MIGVGEMDTTLAPAGQLPDTGELYCPLGLRHSATASAPITTPSDLDDVTQPSGVSGPIIGVGETDATLAPAGQPPDTGELYCPLGLRHSSTASARPPGRATATVARAARTAQPLRDGADRRGCTVQVSRVIDVLRARRAPEPRASLRVG